jgi:hypothetical protein
VVDRSTLAVLDEVTVWTDPLGVPHRLVWGARRYRVSDTPTPLEFDWSAITHPPAGLPDRMWRFQGTPDDDGEALVFDVGLDAASGTWQLRHVYY